MEFMLLACELLDYIWGKATVIYKAVHSSCRIIYGRVPEASMCRFFPKDGICPLLSLACWRPNCLFSEQNEFYIAGNYAVLCKH
jgi:hypothetical protein